MPFWRILKSLISEITSKTENKKTNNSTCDLGASVGCGAKANIQHAATKVTGAIISFFIFVYSANYAKLFVI